MACVGDVEVGIDAFRVCIGSRYNSLKTEHIASAYANRSVQPVNRVGGKSAWELRL